MFLGRKAFLSNLFGRYYPIFWYSGFHIFTIPIFSFCSLMLYSSKKMSKVDAVIVAFIFYMLFRILFVIFSDSTRGLPSIYNLVVLTSGYLIFRLVFYKHKFDKEMTKSFSSLFVFMLISYQAIYGYSILSGDYSLQHSSLFGFMFGNINLPGIMDAAKTVIYTRLEYGFGEVIPRVVFLAEFPTTSALVLLMTYNCYLRTALKKISYSKLLFLDLLVLISVTYTQSRIMFLAYLFVLLASHAFIMHRNKSLRIFLYAAFPFVLAIAVFSLIQVAELLSSYRASSGTARLESYWMGIKLAYENNFLFGLGIKPRVETLLGIPIGSHSTFISSFVKFGVIGFLFSIFIFAVYPIGCMVRILLHECKDDTPKFFALRSVPILVLWVSFQDIDAYVIASTLIFCSLGLMLKDLQQMRASIGAKK